MVIFIQIFFLLIAGFFTFYLLSLTIVAIVKPAKIGFHSRRQRHFAVIVPAYNEEIVILKTIKNLFHIDYPTELFDVIVIADNCTDRTAEIALSMGAVVWERNDRELRGKGYALKWAFEKIEADNTAYEAVVIIDADTTVSKNILNVMNNYIHAGAEAIQCSDLVEHKNGSWTSEIIGVSFQLNNYVKLLGRRNIGCTAGLRGNGMCFTTDLLERIPWQAFSQTEDLEYGLILLLNGIPVMFAPEAVVSAIMPADPHNAETQRARWEVGRLPLMKKYFLLLFIEAVRKRSFMIFEAFLDLITPAFVNIFVFTGLVIVINLLLMLFSIPESSTFFPFWLMLLALQVFYVIAGLYISKADKKTYIALLNVPKYILWKILLYFKLVRRGHNKMWVRTAREDSLNVTVKK